MARRYYRRDNGGAGGLIGIIITFVLMITALVLGVIFHEPIGNWLDSFEQNVNSSVNSGDDQNGEQNGEQNNAQETEDFVFERKLIRFTPSMKESDGLQVATEFRLSPEKNREVLATENKVLVVCGADYEKHIEPFMKQGYTYAETIEAALSIRAEEAEQDLNTLLLNWYNTNYSRDVSTDRIVDENGEVKDVLRSYSSVDTKYDKVNVRYVSIGLILTNNDGKISYEASTLGGKSFSDIEVSSSAAYEASLFLNQMRMYEQPYNATVAKLCTELVNKACAQAKGYTEEEYKNGVTVGDPIKSGTTITMKVGETKKFVPEQLIDVQLRFDYVASHQAAGGDNWQGYTIDGAGNITALKAGTYKVIVNCAWNQYTYTLNITE